MCICVSDAILCKLTVKVSRIKYGLFTLTESIITTGNHNHFPAFSFRNQIVHDEIQLPVPDPSGLILSNTMHNIENRIIFVSLLIGGRCINIAALHMSVYAAYILMQLHISMRNIFDKPEILPRFRKFKEILCPKASITKGRNGVANLHSIHIPVMIMESGSNARHFFRIIALCILFEDNSVFSHASSHTRNLHALCIRCIHGKNYLIILRYNDSRPIFLISNKFLSILFHQQCLFVNRVKK